jgi:DNA-binding response OmpR family regulator
VNILLVDDDAELTSLLGEFLHREGFSVEAAHEGSRGLEKALQPGVDLVVLDVMLPGIDGFEILRRLRQKSKVPVLMLTARGEDVDRIVGLNLGPTITPCCRLTCAELAARSSHPAPLEPHSVAPRKPYRNPRHLARPGAREVFCHGALAN